MKTCSLSASSFAVLFELFSRGPRSKFSSGGGGGGGGEDGSLKGKRVRWANYGGRGNPGACFPG